MSKVLKEDIKREEVLTAVVLAENFSSKFEPLTKETPYALLPLQGKPLIEYTFAQLQSNGFQQVFLFCLSSSVNQLREYISKSPYGNENSQMKIEVFSSPDFVSIGDMMRDLNERSLVRQHFLLIQAGSISNENLIDVLNAHKQHMEKDKTLLMTFLCRKLGLKHPTRSPDGHFVAVLNQDNRMLGMTPITSKNKTYFSLDKELFQKSSSLSLRSDLVETKIVACHSDVPSFFADFFDAQTMDDFVRTVYNSEETMIRSFYLYEGNENYSIYISNLTLYNRVAIDVAKRWVYPFAVDVMHKDIMYRRGGCYTPMEVSIGQGTTISLNSVILGKVGSNCEIQRSFVGANSKIEDNVKLSEVTIGKNVHVETGCELRQCFISDNCVIYRGTKLSEGCILGANVKVGPNVELKHLKLVSKEMEVSDGFGDAKETQKGQSPSDYGKLAQAFEYSIEDDFSDDDLSEDGHVNIEEKWGMGEDAFSDGLCSESESDEDADSEHDEIDGGEFTNSQQFFIDVVECLKRGAKENIDADNLILEINGCKHAFNINIGELVGLTVKAILEFCVGDERTGDAFMDRFKKANKQLLAIFRNYVKKEDTQRLCIVAIGDYFDSLIASAAQEALLKTMQNVVNFLYNKDILSEDVILEWNEESENKSCKYIKAFIEWLEASSEEDESDDEDDDD